MKPDFNAMSRAELLAYLKEHRTDDEAWGIFSDRATPMQYPAPLDGGHEDHGRSFSRQNSRTGDLRRVDRTEEKFTMLAEQGGEREYRHVQKHSPWKSF